ncbi:putative L-ribulokinase [Trypanosoma conorhini]|uniref:KIF-binding protein n=1 Tax=Trypanosoma conorhini TaxID=83891 RepID=A0A3R7NVC7_9TRYP|nr:putative L-ribulokinase [Trypanosoma conorhini]RNF27676.1 putative L-ribulokinase [Trypanosoma conorhini]
MEGEKPLSDKKLNAFTDKTQSFYTRFCDTWKDPKENKLPETLDADSRLPFFRALMRLAHLQTKRYYKNPKDEYDNISVSIVRFKRVLDFAASNPMKEEAEVEVKLAREMLVLLPTKQNDLWRVYHNTVE